jgi:hypothetical protein
MVVKSARMTAKDERLTFRVRSELKKDVEAVAAKESRSVAQICEAFLRAGLSAYKKDGTKYIHRFLSRRTDEE